MTDATEPITNYADFIDSRDVIARIEHLKAEWTEATGDDPADYGLSSDDWAVGLGEEGASELVALLDLADEGGGLSDWEYGATLIRDSYFEDYAREFAEDIGAVPNTYTWPVSHIDWEVAAEALQMDYTAIDFDGVTYWGRS